MPQNNHSLRNSAAIVCCFVLVAFMTAWSLASARNSNVLVKSESPDAALTNPGEPESVAPTPAVGPSPVASVPPTSRDLSQYENAGTISVGTSVATRRSAFSQTREFLTRKWSERQLGRIALVSTTPTGRPTTSHFYVERNAEGSWRVVLEAERGAREEFYVVEEIGVAADGRPILEPRPGGPQPVSRALHLKRSATAKSGFVF